MYWTLFLTFAKIGAFYLRRRVGHDLPYRARSSRQTQNGSSVLNFSDLLAVAQSLPGILAVNISVVVGDKLRSLKGTIAAALGTITPCFFIILLIAMFLTPEMITTNPTITAIFKGIRPVVVALILCPGCSLQPKPRISAGKWPGFRGGGTSDLVEMACGV